MKHETYNNAKQCLISIAKEAKRLNRNDKPMIREIINDQADQMHRPLLLGHLECSPHRIPNILIVLVFYI